MTDPHPPDEGAPSTDPADGKDQPPTEVQDRTTGSPTPVEEDPAAVPDRAEVDRAAEEPDPAENSHASEEPDSGEEGSSGETAGRPDSAGGDQADERSSPGAEEPALAESADTPASAEEGQAPGDPDSAEVDPAAGNPDSAGDQAAEVGATPERAGVPAPLRSRRTLAFAAAALLVVAAVVVTLIVVIPGKDDRPVPSGSMPTLASQFAIPPPGTPAQSPPTGTPLSAYQGNPLWTVQLPGGTDEHDLPGFAVSDNGYVLHHDTEVQGLDRTGKQIWRFTPPEVDYFTVRVTGPQVLVGYSNPDEDRWPQPQVIVALDAATGKELWRETEASLWSATTDTVYMSVCYGGQNNRIGDCQLTARDPRSNTIRWSVATYASSRLVNDSEDIQTRPTPPHLLVEAYPTGAASAFVSAHDPGTGATLGGGYEGPDERIGQIDAPTERSVVTIDDRDENPADGCQATVTGFAVSGAELWRQAARTGKENDGRRCASMSVSYNGGRMGITAENGAPSVLNLNTGAIEWSAPATGEGIAASGTTLLAVESSEEDVSELVAYRIGNAKPLWRAPFPGGADPDSVTITGSQAVFTRGEAVGYDLKSGKAWSYGGSVAQETSEWFAICSASSCRAYPIG